jgi:hypothetical protein
MLARDNTSTAQGRVSSAIARLAVFGFELNQ